jgi:eukaryotic-like serine/threonine-protein kinase
MSDNEIQGQGGEGIRQVVDTNGIRYVLDREIGHGGQGKVYAVKGDRVAVKLIMDPSASRRDSLSYQLTSVRRMSLSDVPIANPLEMLRPPHLGYVMKLLGGMTALKDLAYPPQAEDLDIAEWYFAGGGLRRRLRLLAYAADILAQLHGKALVYADPSPYNIFISEDPENHQVQFIDADNLQYQSSSAGPNYYTPGYGAPELVREECGVNTLTDAHAFAVMVFHTLTLVHPLMGDLVTQCEPEMEESALKGEVPWVDHPDDESNRSSDGIQPYDMVLSRKLRELAQQTFGPGLSNPSDRPGVGEWRDVLHRAADSTLICPACDGSFYYRESCCPWCDEARSSFVRAVFYLWDPSLGDEGDVVKSIVKNEEKSLIVEALSITDKELFVITERLKSGKTDVSAEKPCLEIQVDIENNQMHLRSLDGSCYQAVEIDGRKIKAEIGSRARRAKIEGARTDWILHLGEMDALHRVAHFEVYHRGG